MYQWIQGDLDDVDRLPILENVPKSLCRDTDKAVGGVLTGQRNSALFSDALRALASGISEADLMARAMAFNNMELAAPLAESEVLKTIKSAQNYQNSGNNWVGKEARAIVTASELDKIEGNADAAYLLIKLKAAHGWRQGDSFALANAYADALNWTLRRFRTTRTFLTEKGFIRCIHLGGKGPNDPPLYVLL